jgi:signal transduction histidine kinase
VNAKVQGLVWTVIVAAGAAIGLVSLLAVRWADWPIYVVFLLVNAAVCWPTVEVLPRLRLPVPNVTVSIAFVYIGGLPILVMRVLSALLTRSLLRALPWRAARELAASLESGGAGQGDLLWDIRTPGGMNATAAAEWAIFTLGLAVRWWIARALSPDGVPTAHPWAIAVAEVAGQACWGLCALLPIYPDRPLLPLTAEPARLRTALSDIGIVFVFALTPFVFLIAYGYRSEGLVGAAAWSLSTLGLHFMLKSMNERRLIVEEQNRRLEALNRELEHRERLSAIGKMSSVVSHQILHQLGVIGIYADLIRNADGEGHEDGALTQAREHARGIEAALGDVNRVLTDLLVFSKDLRLNLYEHPLRSLLEECVESCRADAGARGVELRVDGGEGLAVTLDKLKIKQALLNVLRNAIEASPAGSSVVASAAVQGCGVEVVISDQGPGVPDRDRDAIFAPFFTTKEHGTGLGLAIAREFAEAHGGGLRVEPNPGGRGARFVFSLPGPGLPSRGARG